MGGIELGLRVQHDHPGDVIRRVGDFFSGTCGLGEGPPLEINALNDLRLFFGSVFPDLKDLYWVVNGAMFYLPESSPEGETLPSDTIEEDNLGWRVMRPGFLDRYADHLHQDWLDLYGLPDPPASLSEFKRNHY